MASAWQRRMNDGEVMWRRERDGWKNAGGGWRGQLDGWRDWSWWPYRCFWGGNRWIQDWSLWVFSVYSLWSSPPPPKKKFERLWSYSTCIQTHTHRHTKIKLWVEYIFFKGNGFLMALMENCKPLLRGLLCISAHTSVSRRFTLLDDLMAASCPIIPTET